MTKRNNTDLNDANNTTNLPEAEAEESRWRKLESAASRKFQPTITQRSNPIPRGRFSAGAGDKQIDLNTSSAASWVIFTVHSNEHAQVVSELLSAWKDAESEIPHPFAELKIILYKYSQSVHAVLEIGDSDSNDVVEPLKIAERVMIRIANRLLERGYSCSP